MCALWFLLLKQRLGPSAEMVMIDRMFIQEEKIALSQDRILARERPGTYIFVLDTLICVCYISVKF